MSVILPYQYKYISDKLGEMYARIRDAYYGEGDSTAAYNIAQNTLSQASNPPVYSVGGIEAESDYTTWGCAPAGSGESEDPDEANYSAWISSTTKYTAPPASIGRDLKQFWYTFANVSFTDEQAKTLATNAVGPALRRLNAHIVSRMSANTAANRDGLDGEAFVVSNISNYYSNYGYVTDADAAVGMTASQLSLFDLGAEAGLDSSATYFTQDFAELSARIGVTIDSDYVQ